MQQQQQQQQWQNRRRADVDTRDLRGGPRGDNNDNRRGDWNRDNNVNRNGGNRGGDWNRGDNDRRGDGARNGGNRGGDWNRGDNDRRGDGNRGDNDRRGDRNRGGRDNTSWDNNRNRGGRDWDRDGRRGWVDNDSNRRDWDRRRHDTRYRPYYNTHRDFSRPRYNDWRHVRHGYYFDRGYSSIVSVYFGRTYYWWGYDGWRRPYRRWAVGYAIPAWLYWEPVPWDLYYRLPPAPYGCRYVYADGDILLVAIATGIILDALLYEGYY
ncbi:MAG: hypothetical protein R3C16_04335 [Hyphomonadaceae bacterium]